MLDRFGLDVAGQRALDRAFDAAPTDKAQLGQTVSRQVSRSLSRLDLAGARLGLARASAAEMPAEDLVYSALWVRLLERKLKVPFDALPERILSQSQGEGGWVGRIAAFGAGKLAAGELVSAAKTPAERTEALFYGAFERLIAGDSKGAEAGFKQTLSSDGAELVEVDLARELLGGRPSPGQPPANVVIP